MASFLDVTLFSHFSVVFSVLLIFVILYAILEKTKFLGKNQGINALVALCVSMLMLFAPGVVMVIQIMAPWFVLMIFMFFIILMSLQFMGVKESSITAYMQNDWDTVHWFILAFMLIITIGAIGAVYGQSLLPYSNPDDAAKITVTGPGSGEESVTDTGDFNQNVGRVIFHPKVLGLIFLLLVASFTIRSLTSENLN